MKKLFYILLFFGSVLNIVACSSSLNTNRFTRSEPSYALYHNLADVLRLQGGLMVTGIGNDVRVQIRGGNSINLNNQPYYVINNIPMGRDYGMANNAINPIDIISIRVLRSYHELTTYGEMGKNGVIEIKTRTYDQ
ncbi:MAG: TonB-dependent receptor plug domain-containing protein [Bacteroidetes bacterium]|nr:TonB-dependent receptor plug domain-containing protein [Bacteroidota bacterium]MCH8232193.1 TonB-dependent receptor plug domain-containing protein [Bacteroidota bacterium]